MALSEFGVQAGESSSAEWWDMIPSIDEPPADFVPEKRKPPLETGISRRRILQSIGVIGGGLALNGLGWFSGINLRSASATVGTEHTNCAGYDNWNGYNNNAALCVGGTYSSIYCGTDGWFKNGTFGSTQYRPVSACGAVPYVLRNAWRWRHASVNYRCADGNIRYYSNGAWSAWMFRICAKRL